MEYFISCGSRLLFLGFRGWVRLLCHRVRSLSLGGDVRGFFATPKTESVEC